MTPAPLRIGTRPSALAVAQTGIVAERLRAAGHRVELVEIRTSGDLSTAPVAQLGVGVFVSALREALVRGEVDLAVHSYKDLPTAPVPIRAPVPRSASVAPSRATRTSRGSPRTGTAAMTRPSAGAVGRSM